MEGDLEALSSAQKGKPSPFSRLCQLGLETIRFEEVMITLQYAHKAFALCLRMTVRSFSILEATNRDGLGVVSQRYRHAAVCCTWTGRHVCFNGTALLLPTQPP